MSDISKPKSKIFSYIYHNVKALIASGIILLFPVNLAGQVIDIDTVRIIPQPWYIEILEKPSGEPQSLAPAINIITETKIAKQGANTLIEAMNYIPGGLTETRGRQVKQFFSVRGQKYPYPDYAINGVWQKEFEELPYFFQASDIEELEIIRSSAALLTGLSGLSGLINVKTREYDNFEGRIQTEYGTWNTLHTHVSAGDGAEHFSYAAGAGFDRTDGPAGKHAYEQMATIYGRFNWMLTNKLTLNSSIYYLDGEREMRLAEPPADTRYIDMIQGFDPYRAVLSNIRALYRSGEKASSEIQLSFAHRNPLFYDEVKETTSGEKDYEFGVNYLQSIALASSNILRFGGLYSRWIAPNGKRFYTGKRCDIETYSAVITDEHRTGSLTLDAGFRWTKTYLREYGAFNIEGEGAQFKTVTPIADEWEPAIVQGTLGAAWDISGKLSLHFNSAAGQLKPRQGTLTETMTVPLNETRFKFDLGLVKRSSWDGKFTTTLFSVIQKNAIVLSGSTYLDPETNIRRELYLNRDQKQWGLEFDFTAPEFYNFIRPFFNFTAMRSKMEKDGAMVTNRENPLFIAGGGLYMEKRGFDLNVFFKYVSEFENDRFVSAEAGPQPLGDFLSFDLNGGYTTKWKMPVRFFAKVRNLTNLKYSTVNGYPDFGRLLYAGIEVRFRADNTNLSPRE
ncbi:MAG: TonB-dependent receptor plug domain-containing protein [Bacteroidales bacterium]|nr:TonB-dependent receptor plug domain-containing protein [Bacteroidales bacterium]